MYILLIVGLNVGGLALMGAGFKRKRPGVIAAGLSLLAATALFFSLLSFWGEMLWFDSLGFSARFWKEIYIRLGATLIGALAGSVILYLWTLPVRRKPWLRRCVAAAGAVFGGFWGASGWVPFLAWLYRVPAGSVDPVWGRDIGFFLFVLPFYDRIFYLLLCLGVVSLLLALGGCLGASRRKRGYVLGLNRERLAERSTEVRVALGGILLVLAWGSYLYAYHFMYAKFGAVDGPGWTDVHVRIPAAGVLVVLAALMSVWTVLPVLRRRQIAAGQTGTPEKHLLRPAVLFGTAWVLGMFLAPRLVQWLRVEPNEITFERPYIENNIRFTRQAFGLDRIEERQFPAATNITQSTLDSNQQMLSEIRLWDWRALKAVHKQFQEIRLYYEFQDIDVDRYTIGSRYRQVMLSAREMQVDSLPAQSRTFVNQRFKYTHGYGITMTPVSEFTAEGLPNFSIKDIPPKSAFPELRVIRPEIYFGELTRSHVYVDSSELEFDYPKGDTNQYSRYAGLGGIPIQNFWRRFVFGWMFDGTRFLVSSYVLPDSRILFRRGIRDRVLTVAPFLRLDGDPYITLVDGRLYWILDAYTVSSWYPYSRTFSSQEVIEYTEGKQRRLTSLVAPELDGMNYVRNSVKAVVDAYDGTVTLYVFDPQDPVLQVWRNAFPDLFRTREQMPAGLTAHIRYPTDMLLAQGLTYQKYHMTDPQVFYNQEDLWARATEKYYSDVQPIEPYYIVWKTPESQNDEFVLILPFTPKNRQVMIGWIAGMCDTDHYGRILAYKFPKERQVLGPQQMETKIDQDRLLSAQLTLWDQRGSRVIRGDVLVIPIDDSLLYVEPIYLQAETAAYPELRLVAVMQGENLNYAPSFGEALRGLIRAQPSTAIAGAPATATQSDLGELARKANEAFERYLQLQADQKFVDAAQELQSLRDILKKMADARSK